MCALVDAELTKKYVNKKKNTTYVKVYKRLTVDNNKLLAPFMYTEYKPGINKSNSRAKLQTKNSAEINRGIHVYPNKEDASRRVRGWEVIVEMKAKISDLICLGSCDEAVFRKVELSQKEYDRALKQ